MEDYSRANTIDGYFEKIDTKKMNFSGLRKALEAEQIDQEEISVVIRQIDKQLLRVNEMRALHSLGKNILYGGLAVTAVGVFLTIATYIGLVDLGNVYIVAYGPIFGGLIMAMNGRSKMNRI